MCILQSVPSLCPVIRERYVCSLKVITMLSMIEDCTHMDKTGSREAKWSGELEGERESD